MAAPNVTTGKAIVRVVQRCDSAKEDSHLDLSDCLLAKVPDAIFLLMKHTQLDTCNISGNTLRRIPSKFGVKFTHLTELILHHNHLENLPEDLKRMEELKTLNIAHNNFKQFPRVVFKLSKLTYLNAEGNRIKDVEQNHFRPLGDLVEVNLRENPLTERSLQQLATVRLFNVLTGDESSDEDGASSASSNDTGSQPRDS